MTIKNNIAWLRSVAGKYRLRIIVNVLLGVTSVALSLLFIYLSKNLIDKAVAGKIDGGLILPAALITATLLAQYLCSILKNYSESYTSTKITNSLREKLFLKVMLAKWKGKEKFHTGDISTRLEGDVKKVADTICTTIPLMAITAVEFLLSFLFMLSLDTRLAWMLFFIMPLSLILSKSYMSRMRKLTHSIRSVDSSVQAHIQEQIQHRSTINALGNTSGSLNSLNDLSKDLLSKTMRRTNYTIFSRTIVRLGFAAGYLTAFIWGVNGLSTGAVTFGVMTAFLQLVAKIQSPVVDLSSQLSSLAQTSTSIDRLRELDNLETEIQGKAKIIPNNIGVKITNLTYNYGKRDVIQNLNADFIPNKMHVIIGETGSGKSTLLRLMLGFIEPLKGQIELYNNTSHTKCSPLTRDNFIYVPQGNSLISGTILDNILLGNPSATPQQVSEVVHTAVADFIYDLPEGLNTYCGEKGAGISEGEAQRIAIARGLLRTGGIVLLDEPTSALDGHTETLLLERLAEFASNKTIIIVTHRENTNEFCSSALKINKIK